MDRRIVPQDAQKGVFVWPHEFASYKEAEAVIADAYRITTILGSTRHWDM